MRSSFFVSRGAVLGRCVVSLGPGRHIRHKINNDLRGEGVRQTPAGRAHAPPNDHFDSGHFPAGAHAKHTSGDTHSDALYAMKS